MAYQDLRDFMTDLQQQGLLKKVETEVDPILEITQVTDRVSKKGGPAIWFNNVKGSPYPMVTNLFGSYYRMSMAFGVENLDQVGQAIAELIQPPEMPGGLMEKLKALPKLAELSSFMPKIVRKGPCQEVIESNPSLDELPILQCWPEDGGRFITLPLVFTKDPETRKRNVGMYRMHVFDSRTTGMHWHMHKDGAYHFARRHGKGERMEVAVALGGDPATIYSATAPLPRGIDELTFAGFLRKQPVELVKCKTVDLEVPAHAEFVLEGYVDPGETRLEGPFGDHTGYYSLADYYPVFHLTCITRRKDPIYPATIVGKPPMEDCYMGKATERIFLPLLKMQLPEIVDMNLPWEGVFHNCVVVSIDKRYPGHAKKVMHALWGMGQMMFSKMIIVVDKDVDVQEMSTVWWKVFNNIDARRDVTIVDGPLDALDHASPLPHYGAKMGIDATKKWPGEGHNREWPDEIMMDKAIVELVERRWEEYGID